MATSATNGSGACTLVVSLSAVVGRVAVRGRAGHAHLVGQRGAIGHIQVHLDRHQVAGALTRQQRPDVAGHHAGGMRTAGAGARKDYSRVERIGSHHIEGVRRPIVGHHDLVDQAFSRSYRIHQVGLRDADIGAHLDGGIGTGTVVTAIVILRVAEDGRRVGQDGADGHTAADQAGDGDRDRLPNRDVAQLADAADAHTTVGGSAAHKAHARRQQVFHVHVLSCRGTEVLHRDRVDDLVTGNHGRRASLEHAHIGDADHRGIGACRIVNRIGIRRVRGNHCHVLQAGAGLDIGSYGNLEAKGYESPCCKAGFRAFHGRSGDNTAGTRQAGQDGRDAGRQGIRNHYIRCSGKTQVDELQIVGNRPAGFHSWRGALDDLQVNQRCDGCVDRIQVVARVRIIVAAAVCNRGAVGHLTVGSGVYRANDGDDRLLVSRDIAQLADQQGAADDAARTLAGRNSHIQQLRRQRVVDYHMRCIRWTVICHHDLVAEGRSGYGAARLGDLIQAEVGNKVDPGNQGAPRYSGGSYPGWKPTHGRR